MPDITSSRYISYRDILAGRKPDGNIDTAIVEMLAQENPVLLDVLWRECNKGREDIVTIRTGMPEAVARAYYEGWKGSKTSKRQVANSCGTVSTGIEFDWRLYEASKDKVAFLADEQRAHSSVLGDKTAELLFYGRTDKDPKGINGFARTFSEYAEHEGRNMLTDDTKAAFYCLSAGGAGADVPLRSLFLVGWGSKTCHGIYPEGSKMGIQIGQLKDQYITDEDGGNLLVGMQELNQDVGLNIRDFRYSGRICNIDITKNANDQADLVMLIRKLVTRVKSTGATQRFYCSRLVFEAIAEQFEKKTNANAIRYADLEQKKDATLLGIPVALCDCMNTNEEQVPAIA